jgi:IPT/TIG domain
MESLFLHSKIVSIPKYHPMFQKKGLRCKTTIHLFLLFFILLFISACKKDSSIVSQPPVLTITGVKPLMAKQGDTIIIIGSNFNLDPSMDTVRFNGIPASVQKATADTLFVIIPAGNCTGVVTVNGIAAPGPGFTVGLTVLMIKAVNPRSGKQGDTIIITGSNFNPDPSMDTVRFNGIPARVQKATADTLFVIVPAGNCTGVVTVNGITAPGPGFTLSPTIIMPSGTSIYIGGESPSGTGVIWKHGLASPVPDSNWIISPSRIISLSYSGNNLYALGYSDINSGSYFVNGIQPTLQCPYAGTAILATGPDVYITCETRLAGGGDVLYWKNGQIINLTQNVSPHVYAGIARGIASSGSDVYICGAISFDSLNDYTAVYWKNDSIHYIPHGEIAQHITVSGDSVFTCGSADHGEAYWINDSIQGTFYTSEVVPTGLAVSGSDVYVCVTNYRNQLGPLDAGYYLRNGQMTTLPNSAEVTGIAVRGSDVYCVGGDHDGNAVYWKNTEIHVLGPGTANCIVIVP